MSEFGIKILNIEASTVFEHNNGVRERYDYKEAMFVNSLFSDYLLANGLKITKGDSSRDIICLEFNYGSRSYDEEAKHLLKLARKARQEYRLAKSLGNEVPLEKARYKRKKIEQLISDASAKRDSFVKKSKDEIRSLYYANGVDVEYVNARSDGTIKKREVVHYKMLYRSTGKAKKGSCMFICDRLYDKAINFLRMEIQLPDEHAPIVEISAYSPLISSAIVGRIKINPKNILILNDVDRFFETNVVSIETDEARHCIAKYIENYRVKNTLFDGQALIDIGICPDWANGYVLLRQHFCKMAAFKARIQDFFRDYFGDRYETATVKDMFGKRHKVKDIEVITTDNAMKWLKFDVSYKDWCGWVKQSKNMFGVVKTAHASKLGDVQKMSYQMVNSLSEDIMETVARRSVEYICRLKQDEAFFLDFLRKNANFSNDFEVLIALCEHNPAFVRSEYFRDRKNQIIHAYIRKVKSGKIVQNADNLVIVGSPYAMLLYGATGKEVAVDDDDTFSVEPGTIQCYTKRFSPGDFLAFFRSPFNSKNNLTYLHNVYDERLEKYFDFSNEIVAVNMIGTDFQDRNNGSDQDSDSGYCTNQPDVVEHARRCYLEYPTIVNNIPKDKNIYDNTPAEFARMDNTLAGAQRDIGESSNLAQIAQTYDCTFDDEKYKDYVCILSVLAQIAIDNAKRRFDIDVGAEIQRIKRDMDIATNKYPIFWRLIKKDFDMNRVNFELHCPMNSLYNVRIPEFKPDSSLIATSEFFQKVAPEKSYATCKKVEALIEKFSLRLYECNVNGHDHEAHLLLRNDFEDLIAAIKSQYISSNYIGLFSWLIDRAFLITPKVAAQIGSLETTLNKNRSLLLKVLYDVNPKSLLKCFSANLPAA